MTTTTQYSVQWWLARLDQHGNPTLCDGAHSDREGADHALEIFQSLGFVHPGERYAVARVELSDPLPTTKGVNQDAARRCKMMLDRAKGEMGRVR